MIQVIAFWQRQRQYFKIATPLCSFINNVVFMITDLVAKKRNYVGGCDSRQQLNDKRLLSLLTGPCLCSLKVKWSDNGSRQDTKARKALRIYIFSLIHEMQDSALNRLEQFQIPRKEIYSWAMISVCLFLLTLTDFIIMNNSPIDFREILKLMVVLVDIIGF